MPLAEEPFYPAGPRGVTGDVSLGGFQILWKLDGLGSNQILGKLDGSRRGREESARSNGIIGK